MVLVDSVLLGLAIGLLLGGRIGRLGRLQLHAASLAYAAVGLQIAAFPSGVLPWSTPSVLARGLWITSYGLLIVFLARNRSLIGTQLVAAGLACNLVAITANRGLMPATRSALLGAGRSYDVHNNSISAASPHLALLVDRWAVPAWIPLGNVFSIGDVLIALGTAVTVALALQPSPRLLRRRTAAA
jgi:hypothetical protein